MAYAMSLQQPVDGHEYSPGTLRFPSATILAAVV